MQAISNIRLFRPLVVSLVLHSLVLGLVLVGRPESSKYAVPTPVTLELEKNLPAGDKNKHKMAGNRPAKSVVKRSTPKTNVDLRPGFIKDHAWGTGSHVVAGRDVVSGNSTTSNGSVPDAYISDLIYTDPKVFKVFDILAERIHVQLDYPTLLVKDGIQGTALLDLYFDSNGNVEETRSRIQGSNRSIRGLFVRAVRKALPGWYLSDASRLAKNQFRSQHFRADFVISHGVKTVNSVSKGDDGTYSILRRRYVHPCWLPHPTGVIPDVFCLAIRAAGAVEQQVSSTYRMKLEAEKDALEYYDSLGLVGVNEEIKGV